MPASQIHVEYFLDRRLGICEPIKVVLCSIINEYIHIYANHSYQMLMFNYTECFTGRLRCVCLSVNQSSGV